MVSTMRLAAESWPWSDQLTVSVDPAVVVHETHLGAPTSAHANDDRVAVLFVGDPARLTRSAREVCGVLTTLPVPATGMTVAVDAARGHGAPSGPHPPSSCPRAGAPQGGARARAVGLPSRCRRQSLGDCRVRCSSGVVGAGPAERGSGGPGTFASRHEPPCAAPDRDTVAPGRRRPPRCRCRRRPSACRRPEVGGTGGRAGARARSASDRARRLPRDAPSLASHQRSAADPGPRLPRRRRSSKDALQRRHRGTKSHGYRAGGRAAPAARASRPATTESPST